MTDFTKMITKHLPITPLDKYSEIRVDTIGNDTHITVYNCDIHHLDLLIMQLQALRSEYADMPVKQVENEEPPQMTAVLGPKPNPAEWYGKALQKNANSPMMNAISFREEIGKDMQPPAIVIPMPPMPQPKRAAGVINVIGVVTKQRKHYGGNKQVNENADIKKGEWIRIYGISDNRVRYDKDTQKQITYRLAYDRTFKMGDTVEYGSYNYSYTGTITAIGEKTITIESYGKSHRLDLHEFIWRNWDLDLEKIAEERANFYD